MKKTHPQISKNIQIKIENRQHKLFIHNLNKPFLKIFTKTLKSKKGKQKR